MRGVRAVGHFASKVKNVVVQNGEITGALEGVNFATDNSIVENMVITNIFRIWHIGERL